jgi:hypothetical protein
MASNQPPADKSSPGDARPRDSGPPLEHPASAASLAAGHETSDVRVRAILAMGLGMAIGGAIAHASLWYLFHHFRYEARRSNPPVSPLAQTDQTPPSPRLQSAPLHDLAEFRQEKQRELQSYAWVDRRQKVVRIPIARAIELVAERGIPPTKAPAPPPPDSKAK